MNIHELIKMLTSFDLEYPDAELEFNFKGKNLDVSIECVKEGLVYNTNNENGDKVVLSFLVVDDMHIDIHKHNRDI